MPRGAAVIRYEGPRGVVWRIKFRDAERRQVQETLGPESRGWTEKKAQRELGKRLADVAREHYCHPQPLAFGDFAARFETEYLPGRNLKASTLLDYKQTIRHLTGFFDGAQLAEVEARPQLLDAYIAAKTTEGLAAKTVRNHLGTLRVMFKVAIRWRLARTNPVLLIDLPRVVDSEMNVLSEVEIARLLAAYDELAAEAEETERPWLRITKRLVLVALGTALRRGELLALRWQDVQLLEGLLTVRRAFVRNEFTTPKSRSSRRTLELGPRMIAVLQEQWQDTLYRGDADLVFGHPQLGTPLDGSKLSTEFMKPALKRAKIEKPFRPWHDLRHTALTHEAAAGNPQAYVQHKAGHSQGSITERYIHAAQVLFPGAAEKGEARLFGEVVT